MPASPRPSRRSRARSRANSPHWRRTQPRTSSTLLPNIGSSTTATAVLGWLGLAWSSCGMPPGVGELDRVLILAPDRLARHYAYQYVVVEELERAGCEVLFVNGPGGHTSEERLVREVHGLFAEFERAALQERSRRGQLHPARAGPFFSGTATHGHP